MYEPREDSFLLLKAVKKYAKGNVLDMGTGSGILAFEASRLKNVNSVVGTDIDKESIDYCRKRYKSHKLIFLKSDLFKIFKSKSRITGAKSASEISCERVRKLTRSYQAPINSVSEANNIKNLINHNKKFDTIIFNPPYLPKEFMYPREFDDKTIFGGKKGYEVIGRFLKNAKPYLNKKGYILLLFSSQTKKKKIDDLIKKNNFSFKQIYYLKLDFEELYVYLIK